LFPQCFWLFLFQNENMDNLKTVSWGIIGCGDVTEVKSGPAYQQTEGFEILAVMRRDKDKAADYARRHNVPKVYANADDLISDNEIDAVYIATNEKNIPLFIAYYRRSLPRFDKIKEWLDKKRIGEVRHIRWHLSKPPSDLDLSKETNWRTDAQVAPGGYFDDLASHGLDFFVYLLGNIKEVNGFAINQMGLYSAKDAVIANWVHENGITGEGSWNFGSYQHEEKVEIFGAEGKIMFSVFDEEPIVLINSKGEERLDIPHPKHIQKYHVGNIKTHLDGGVPHPSLGNSALHASWVMDKILGVH